MVGLEAFSTLLVTAKTLYDASQNAKENCEECAAIYRTVVSLDEVVRKSAGGVISESMMLRLNKITRILSGIADLMRSLQKRPWLYRLLHNTRVKGKLRLARQELFDATQEFQIGTNTETLSVSQEVRQCLQNLQEASQRDEAVVQNVYFQVLSFSDAAMIEKLGVPESKMQEAILALHKHIPELQDGPEKECCTRSLDALQRRSGELPILPDKYAISSFEVEINRGKKLGSGGFANVYEGIYKEKVVAVKELHEGTHWSVIQSEVEIWRELDHEHILKFIGACPVAEKPFMVCEMKVNGDVLSYLKKQPNASKRKILYEASLGLKYLHEKSVVHSDIKANNILIDERGVACLSDFGLSRIKLQATTVVDPDSATQPQQGTARWMAPEHLAGGTASKRSDIYSFAMTIYEVFSGRPPFPDLPANMLFVVVHDNGRRPEWTDDVRRKGLDEPMWNVVTGCWQQNPRERSSAAELADQLGHLLAVERSQAVAPQIASIYSDSAVPRYKPGGFLQQTSPTTEVPMNQTAPVALIALPRPGRERIQHYPRPQTIAVSPIEDYSGGSSQSSSGFRDSPPPAGPTGQREVTVETLSSHLLFPDAGPNSLPSPANSSSPEATDLHPDPADVTVSDISSTLYEESTRTMTSVDYRSQPSPPTLRAVDITFDATIHAILPVPEAPARARSPEPLIRFDEALEKLAELAPLQRDLEAGHPPPRQPLASVADVRSYPRHRDRRTPLETLDSLVTEKYQQPLRKSVLLSTGSRTPTPPLSPDLVENTKSNPGPSAEPRLQASRSHGNRSLGALIEDDYVIRIVQEHGVAHPAPAGGGCEQEKQRSPNPPLNVAANPSYNTPTTPLELLTPAQTFSTQPQIARSPPLGTSNVVDQSSYFDGSHAPSGKSTTRGFVESFPASSSTSSTSSPELGPEDLPELSSSGPEPSTASKVVQAKQSPLDRQTVTAQPLKSNRGQTQTEQIPVSSERAEYKPINDRRVQLNGSGRYSATNEDV